MNEIQVFDNGLYGQVRTIIENGKILFCGLDIASALGYRNTRYAISSHCPHVVKRDTGVQTGKKPSGEPIYQNIEMSFIPEGDVYRLIVRSRLPEAEKFERWLFDEVVPSIRKTGGYIPVNSQDDEVTIMAKAHRILERTLQEKDNIIEAKSKALQIAQPKADKYDKLISADGYLSFNVAAKQLGTGRNRLMKLLRDKGILFRDGLSNIAYQTYCERGYFVVKYSVGKNGYACGVTKVTPKGLSFLYDMLNGKELLVS